jgi:hypothetical protein
VLWIRIRQFEDDEPKFMKYEPILALFQGFEPLLEARIWIRSRSRIRIRVKSRIRIRIKIKISIRIRINVMRIHNTVSNRHDLALESDIVALPIDNGLQPPWKGFNQVLNVLGVLHYFTAFLHFCAVHSKPARPNVFILGLQNAIFISILASSYDLPVPIV